MELEIEQDFCKIRMKGKQLFTLFTNFHVIPEDIIDSKKTISIY